MAGINLQKRAESVGIILAKRGITKVPPTRVGVALDVSGSAQNLYTGGVIQETLDRLLAVALKFDDNGELDAWTFDNQVGALPTITAADEGTYVKKNILGNRNLSLWGGTSYAPPLKAAMDHYFGTKTITEKVGGLFGFGAKNKTTTVSNGSKDPAMLLFVTDGANQDRNEAAQVLREAAKNSPVYFQMVGVGPESYFTFLKEMADELPNVGFVSLSTLSITDEALYEALVNPEFCEWIKKQAV